MTFSARMAALAVSLLAVAAHHEGRNLQPARDAVRTVSGRTVQAGNGTALAQVQVVMTGPGMATKTARGGTFQLSDVPSGVTQLVLRHPCYFPVQVTIPADGDVDVVVGLPFDRASLQRPGCGGLGARRPDTTLARFP